MLTYWVVLTYTPIKSCSIWYFINVRFIYFFTSQQFSLKQNLHGSLNLYSDSNQSNRSSMARKFNINPPYLPNISRSFEDLQVQRYPLKFDFNPLYLSKVLDPPTSVFEMSPYHYKILKFLFQTYQTHIS